MGKISLYHRRVDKQLQLAEKQLTFRIVVISIILTIILATANAFLALKLGMLTSASIPAAILAMGILRFFKNSSIHENNLIQTAASAGEAVAGGIVYTIPALVVIGFWQQFSYWENFFLALISGLLGVIFSIPLRRKLVHHPSFSFPEGRAIANLLKNQTQHQYFRILLWGLVVGASLDGLQNGFQVLAESWLLWLRIGHSMVLFSCGFSIAMLGAGFLVGRRMALSILIGVMLAWYLVLPYLSLNLPGLVTSVGPMLVHQKLRFVGIGALMLAGILSLLSLLRPLLHKMFLTPAHHQEQNLRVEDIPRKYLLCLLGALILGVLIFFQHYLPWTLLPMTEHHFFSFLSILTMFIVLVGALMAVVSAYFSAMVGVSASPGSSVVISALLLAAFVVMVFCQHHGFDLSGQSLLATQAVVIVLTAMVTGIAAIANDNMQDLKVGQLIGTSPWQQQLMLILGVLISSLVIPAVMQILNQVYGIAGVDGLPAPTAVLLATMTQGFFQGSLPWNLIAMGGALMGLCYLVLLFRPWGLSIFGIAIGIYLPLETSTPLMIGGAIAAMIEHQEQKGNFQVGAFQSAVCFACGLVAGAAVMDVFVAFILAFAPHAAGVHSHSAYTPLWTVGILLTLLFFGLKKLPSKPSA